MKKMTVRFISIAAVIALAISMNSCGKAKNIAPVKAETAPTAAAALSEPSPAAAKATESPAPTTAKATEAPTTAPTESPAEEAEEKAANEAAAAPKPVQKREDSIYVSAADIVEPDNDYRIEVLYPEDEAYPTEKMYLQNTHMIFIDKNLDFIRKAPTYTVKNGKEVPGLLSKETLLTNQRCVRCVVGEHGMSEKEVFGPNIVINGYAVKPADFYATNWRQQAEDCYITYVIRNSALLQAGILPMENNANVPGVDGYLYDKGCYMLPMGDVERDVTFILEDFDADTYTYFFSAEYNGPASGTSNYFYGVKNEKKGGLYFVKSFYTQYLEPQQDYQYWSVDVTRGYCTVYYEPYNIYWANCNGTRNDVREKINEEFGTHFEPLDYDGDV